MGFTRGFVSLLAATAVMCASSRAVEQAAARVAELSTQSPLALRPGFRILAAQALKDRHPELARKFVLASLGDIHTGDSIDLLELDTLAALAPEETIALMPRLKAGSDFDVAGAFMRTNQPHRAVPIYRAMFGKGQPRTDIAPLFRRLAKESPGEAKSLFADFLTAFSFEGASPFDLFGVTNCADAMAALDPVRAADVYDRVLAIASRPDYGTPDLTATFIVGTATVATANARDTLLLAAGGRLRTLAPERFAKFKDALSRWNLGGDFKVRSVKNGPSKQGTASAAETAISRRMGQLRGLPDSERPNAVLDLAHAIDALPEDSKFRFAESLANLATEGDNGKEAMAAVAESLGREVHRTPIVDGYMELASLVRYEQVQPPFADPAFDVASAVLTLRELVYRDASFTLTGLDGKTYSLSGLRGKVVLLNFWATWCPPCRKEMPDMETLRQRFDKKGLVILAVSDEDRRVIEGYLATQHYTFPILLDPDRKAAEAFGVDGIPKSFIFDRQGNLVAQAMDGRSERQFLELLNRLDSNSR